MTVVFRPTRPGDADAVLQCVRILRTVQTAIERRDCGTGAGGFKPGNKCAGGGDGGGDSTGGFSASGGRAKELTADIQDGGEVTIPDDIDREHVGSFNWDAAEQHAAEGGEGAKELADYTTSQLKFNNYFRYGERLLLPDDATIDQQKAAWRQKWPDGHPTQTPVWDEDAHRFIQKTANDHDTWAQDIDRSSKILDRVNKTSGGKITIEPSKEYTHDPSKADAETIFVPNVTKQEAFYLSAAASNESYFRELYPGATKPSDILPKLNEAIAKHSDAKEHKPGASYIGPRGQILYTINDGETIATVTAGTAMASEKAIKAISAKANPKGEKVVTWRGVQAPPPSLADDDEDARVYLRQLGASKPGDVLKEAGIFSSSASPAAAAGFTSDDGVLLRVVGRSGAPIERISTNKNEHEVAYPDSTQFIVRKVTRRVTVKAGKWHRKNVTVIDIEEN